MTAVDYAFARFTGAFLKSKRIVAVGRYLTGVGKAITKAELNTLLSAGIVMWFVFEKTAIDVSGGYAAGVTNARAANVALLALGLPLTTPVYFAVDESITPHAGVSYFQGIAAIRAEATNGCYGEGALCALLRQAYLTAYSWQSDSTSFPGNATTLPTTQIQQKASGAPISTTDLDILHASDVGQYPRPVPPPPPAPPAPPPPVQPNVVNFPEDNMQRIGPISIPTLDGDGNGSVQVPGVPDVTQIVSVTWPVPDPNVVGAYFAPPRQWSISPTGELLVLEGGSPGGNYSCFVWVA